VSDDRLRIVAWNCCGSFASNFGHLLDLDFDVAVVAECSPLEVDEMLGRTITHALVQPITGGRKHLGIFARAPWVVRPLKGVPSRPYLLPMAVEGPIPFSLLGFWAGSPELYGAYASQLHAVATEVLPDIEGPVVLAGDCNAPIAGTVSAHARNVRVLEGHGLVSAFTAARGGEVDEAAEPTYFHHRKREPGFHIDHVFLPRAWADDRMSMQIGRFDEWVTSGRSDHVPLVVDVDVDLQAAR
jgi:hypothetical protein